jgi:choice-of-anchor A domain-containing protein
MKRPIGSRSTQGTFLLLGAIALGLSSSGCDRGADTSGGDETGLTEVRSELAASCTSSTVKVVDLHADFRDIWKGTETAATGKQADPTVKVGIDFNTTVVPAQVTAQFVPVNTDGSCGPTVAATLASSLTASQVWGTVTTDSVRAPVPSALNVRDGITGIVSAAGAIAAGGDVVLSGMSVNGTAHQPVGLIAGGKVVVSSGSVYGNVTYGVASTIPQTVSVSGTKTLQPFTPAAAFQELASLSVLLGEETATGTATITNGTLQMTGTNAALNVFQVSADTLSQASTVLLTVPANAATVVNVTGSMTVSLQNKGFSVQGATGATLLWNIKSAAFVQISGMSLQGSILAPRSLVTFDSGSINGRRMACRSRRRT